MEKEALLRRLFEVAKFDLRHKHYSHTVKKRKRYKQLIAGVGLDDLLKQFVRRESDPLFEQRKQLTQHIITSVCANLYRPAYKIPRSNSARRTLTYLNDDNKDERVKELEKILKAFNGDTSFDEYMSTDFIDNSKVDPNGFTVVEWDAFDHEKERIAPRPFPVTSGMAVDYKEKNRTLEYLTVRQSHRYRIKADDVVNDFDNSELIVNTKDRFKSGSRYTLYGKNQTFTLTQVHPDLLPTHTPKNDRLFILGDDTYIKLKDRYFLFVEHLPHECDTVPAFRNGWIRDIETDNETFVNLLHDVEPYLMKTIKTNSELDLVAALLAFPQLLRYAQECNDSNCYKGEYENGQKCTTCNGTNMRRTALSAQDAITLPMPDSKEEMIPLGDVAKYLSPDVGIVKWQDDYIDKITEKCKTMLYNGDTFTRSQIQKTATGENLDMQNVYDTLHSLSVKFSKTWRFTVTLIAKLADLDGNIVVNHSFGKDMKLKSLDTLIADLERVSKIGAPALKRHINDDIAQIIYSENPIEHLRYQLKEFYNPFSGKTEKEIMYLLGSGLIPMRDKILYANSGSILDIIELEYAAKKKDFYAQTRSDQLIEINAQIDVILNNLSADAPDPELNLI